MRCNLASILSVTLLLSACRIEQTPREFIDRRDPAAADRDAIARELVVRLPAFAQALNRGNADAAVQALAPAPDAYMLGLGAGESLVGGAPALLALRQLTEQGPLRVTVRDIRTQVGPRGTVGWFAAQFDAAGLPGRDEPAGLRLSGVYVRREGEWRLVQAHWSLSPPPVTVPESPLPADSASPE